MYIFTVLVLLVLGFFSIGRAASTQQRWDWALLHPEHTQLVWLWSVPQVPQKDKRTVVPHTHVLCTLVRSFPTSKSCLHLRDWEHKGGCSARSHYLHNTDLQDYWGGRAPLGITKSNPLPKAGPLKGGCLGLCPGGIWWSLRNAVLHIIFHTYLV